MSQDNCDLYLSDESVEHESYIDDQGNFHPVCPDCGSENVKPYRRQSDVLYCVDCRKQRKEYVIFSVIQWEE